MASAWGSIRRLRRSMRKSYQEIVRYLVVGCINMGIGLSTIFVLTATGSSDLVANAIGYSVGIPVSFMLNGRWTFSQVNLSSVHLRRYIYVIAISYLVNILVLVIARNVGDFDRYISQTAGVLAYSLTSFIGMKYIAFGPCRPKPSASIRLPF